MLKFFILSLSQEVEMELFCCNFDEGNLCEV